MNNTKSVKNEVEETSNYSLAQYPQVDPNSNKNDLNGLNYQMNDESKSNNYVFVQYPQININLNNNEINNKKDQMTDEIKKSNNELVNDDFNDIKTIEIYDNDKDSNQIDNKIADSQNYNSNEFVQEEKMWDKVTRIIIESIDKSLLFTSDYLGKPFIRISQKVNAKCVQWFGL